MPKKRAKKGDKKTLKTRREIIKVHGHHREITTVHDHEGKVVHKIVSPLMVEFHPRDLLQVMLGSALLAVPVGYTEETWRLGEQLPLPNILTILAISIIFIASFVYYNYYKHNNHNLKLHFGAFVKRVLATYFVSLVVVAFLLTVIQVAIWTGPESITAFKRVVIVTFPASISAAVADFLK